MKKLALTLLAIGALFSACKDEKKEDIEMVSPVQVYEAVYGADSLQLIDVRTAEEYSVSHLKNAQNICVTDNDFRDKVAGLDKNKPVYVYCKSGNRSGKAAKILMEMGFEKVYDLQGGITSWEANDLETIN